MTSIAAFPGLRVSQMFANVGFFIKKILELTTRLCTIPGPYINLQSWDSQLLSTERAGSPEFAGVGTKFLAQICGRNWSTKRCRAQRRTKRMGRLRAVTIVLSPYMTLQARATLEHVSVSDLRRCERWKRRAYATHEIWQHSVVVIFLTKTINVFFVSCSDMGCTPR